MSEPVRVLVEVSPDAAENAVTEFAIKHLRARGYDVSVPENWERPSEFLDRVGRNRNFPLRARIREWRERGRTVLALEGISGRVIELLSNPAFDAFCRRNKK